MPVFDPGNGNYLVIDGHIVERDALRIVEKIQEYDERLSVICLDTEGSNAPGVNDAPFLVIRENDNGVYERVLEAWSLDDKIIERIWASDNQKNDILAKLVEMENAKKKEADDKAAEENGAAREMLVAAVKNPKSSFTFRDKETDDLVKIHDDTGVSRNKGAKTFS
jgi:hypothetical protein